MVNKNKCPLINKLVLGKCSLKRWGMNDAVVCRYMQYLGMLMCLSECITVLFFFFQSTMVS